MADTAVLDLPPLLRIPLEIRLIIYKYLLVEETSAATLRAYTDYYEYEQNPDAPPTPVRLLSLRNQNYQDFNPAQHRLKRRTEYKIRAGRYRMQTVPTTYFCVNLPQIHTNILSVNRQIHAEAARVLYSNYMFDFDTHVEAFIPFCQDLTDYARSFIRRVKIVKKALPYEKDFDRCEWRNMCQYISTSLSLLALNLGVVSGKPLFGQDLIVPFQESEFQHIVNIHKRDEMQWVRDLCMIKGLEKFDVAPLVEHCPPPSSNAMGFFIAFSASIPGSFANYLTNQMLHVAQAA